MPGMILPADHEVYGRSSTYLSSLGPCKTGMTARPWRPAGSMVCMCKPAEVALMLFCFRYQDRHHATDYRHISPSREERNRLR